MKIIVECRDCGRPVNAELAQIIKTLISCAEQGHTYYGFMCEYCAEANYVSDDDECEA